MKTERNILIAFVLNLGFSIFELVGGVLTGSVAILSDALHDFGDALSIGVSWYLERKSKRRPDEKYTYGYGRFSVLGSVITTVILLVGSGIVIYNAVLRMLNPAPIHYDGMILFAVVGVLVNLCAAFFTRDGDSLNQKAVNLHMVEDVLGWAVVLVGAIVMRFTDVKIIDPIMSIGVAVFILFNAVGNLKEGLSLLLEKIPSDISLSELREHLEGVPGVLDVHHIHIWSADGQHNYATMHIVAEGDAREIKEKVRAELKEHGVVHSTLEMERAGEHCDAYHCVVEHSQCTGHHHYHHH